MQKHKLQRLLILSILCSVPIEMFGMQGVRRLGNFARAFVTRAKNVFPTFFNDSKNSNSQTLFSRIRNFVKNEKKFSPRTQGFNLARLNSRFENWYKRARWGSVLSGTMGSAFLLNAVQTQGNAKEQEVIPAFQDVDDFMKYPQFKDAFVAYAIEHITTTDIIIADQISRLMTRYPDVALLLAPHVLNNFNKMTTSEGTRIIHTVLQHLPVDAFKNEFCTLLLSKKNGLIGPLARGLSFIYSWRENIQQAALRNIAMVLPHNLDILYATGTEEEKQQLKVTASNHYGGNNNDLLPADMIVKLFNGRWNTEPPEHNLPKPLFLYADYSPTNNYTQAKAYDAALKSFDQLSKNDIESLYIYMDRRQKIPLIKKALARFVLRDNKMINQFVSAHRDMNTDIAELEESVPRFVLGGVWLFCQMLSDYDLRGLSPSNFDYLYFHDASNYYPRMKAALETAAIKKFGDVEKIDEDADIKDLLKDKKINLNALIYCHRDYYGRYYLIPKEENYLNKPLFLYHDSYKYRHWWMNDLVDLLEAEGMAYTVSPDNFDYLYGLTQHQAYHSRIKKQGVQRWGSVEFALDTVIKKPELPKGPNCLISCKSNGVQSDQHFCANVAHVVSQLKNEKNRQTQSAQNMLLEAYKKEQEESKKGNAVFWHGRQWKWDFVAEMYKNIHNLLVPGNEQVGDDYVFLRFDGRETDALCMNYALFGNATRGPSSTAHYVLANHDYSYRALEKYSTGQLFKNVYLQKYYMKYKERLDALESMHEKLNKSGLGSLLMISVPEKDWDYVYPAAEGSMGQNVQARYVNGKRTASIREILEALRKDPKTIQNGNSDYIEFAMRLTRNYALDPKKGPRIYRFDGCDPELKKKFEEEKNKVFADIARDIAADKKLQV